MCRNDICDFYFLLASIQRFNTTPTPCESQAVRMYGCFYSLLCLVGLLTSVKLSSAFQRLSLCKSVAARSNLPPLQLFNIFNNSGKNKQPETAPTATTTNKKGKQIKLEKISNKQKRDWKAESAAAAAAIPKPDIKDKQTQSFNFGKANEFPNLYKGWIRKEGDQIAKQMIAATRSALQKSEKYVEVLFDPVPNLDEVAFGTEWNKKLRKEVVADLKVPDYAANRGGPSTLEWSNLYWGNRLAAGALGGKKVLLLSLSGEGTKGQNIPSFAKGVDLMNLNDAKRKLAGIEEAKYTAIILLSPCQESHYKDGKAIADKLGCPVIALNSPYSFRYDIGGGKPFTLAYVMKRIPKGWIFRQYPKPFEAIVEGPNYEVLALMYNAMQCNVEVIVYY